MSPQPLPLRAPGTQGQPFRLYTATHRSSGFSRQMFPVGTGRVLSRWPCYSCLLDRTFHPGFCSWRREARRASGKEVLTSIPRKGKATIFQVAPSESKARPSCTECLGQVPHAQQHGMPGMQPFHHLWKYSLVPASVTVCLTCGVEGYRKGLSDPTTDP